MRSRLVAVKGPSGCQPAARTRFLPATADPGGVAGGHRHHAPAPLTGRLPGVVHSRSVPNLTQAWTRAEASKPHGWTLRGVALGPREVDPVIRYEKWVAWARGPNGERAEGEGEIPEQALVDLAAKLKAIRPDPNG
jgi:hypothetical protein